MQPIHKVVNHQVDRDEFLDTANAAYGALRNDPEAWAEECVERHLWDQALDDGLDDPLQPPV